MTCDADGRLFVAIFSTRSGGSAPLGVVMVTERNAEPIALPQPDDGSKIAGLNGIVAVPDVGVYATDSGAGTVLSMRETAPGTFTTRIVARDLASANSLAYDAAKQTLYAVSSGARQVIFHEAQTPQLCIHVDARVARERDERPIHRSDCHDSDSLGCADMVRCRVETRARPKLLRSPTHRAPSVQRYQPKACAMPRVRETYETIPGWPN